MQSTTSDRLGDCPRCHAPIPTGNLLIRYERADGHAVYAECPDCREPVHPA